MIAPGVTSEVDMILNLNPAETPTTFDITDPGGTSHYSTPVPVYDSLGQTHTVTVYFTQTAAQTWSWNALIDGADVSGGTAGTPQLFGTGAIAFDTSGALTTAMPASLYTGSITYSNGVAASAISLDFTGSTQYGAPSAIQTLLQDGYGAGNISGISITAEGNIVGNYTNGEVRNIARLALADFPSLYGLERAGSLLFRAMPDSGDPLINKPGEGGMGDISASMLEESNVDLAAEFIKMIITQRAYQANSKIITTTDEMLAQLISIK
jgi:flagellar hook protein FlgE